MPSDINTLSARQEPKPPRFLLSLCQSTLCRLKQCVGGLLIALSLGACGGLPKDGARTVSTAMTDNGRTALARAVRPRVVAHVGQSGLHPLADGHEALAARLALADAAQRSLDVQYFIWNKDMTGKVLLEHLLRAADRGVRVRLLLDDLGTAPSDAILLAIDSHPNIEVRMFNPVVLRSLRLLGILADLGRLNRRMHNKSFTADGQVAIVGGRNIGDEYFGAHEVMNYADLDVVVIGPVVKEVSNEFDLYWNNQSSIPMAALARQNTTPEQFAAKRAATHRISHDRGAFCLRRRPCATLSLPGTSGAEMFPISGAGPRSWTTIPTKLPRPQPRLRRISRRSYATSSVKQSGSCSWSRLTSCRASKASTFWRACTSAACAWL